MKHTTDSGSSPRLDQHAYGARAAGDDGAVHITDDASPPPVSMTHTEHDRLPGANSKLADSLAMAEDVYFDIEFPRLPDLARSADLS
ncbi:MAG: hypothetical protein U0821_10265 [Chloroflexota bacterium]